MIIFNGRFMLCLVMFATQACVHLEELYLAQNKLRQIQGVSNLTKLRTLDLGANRIRVQT